MSKNEIHSRFCCPHSKQNSKCANSMKNSFSANKNNSWSVSMMNGNLVMSEDNAQTNLEMDYLLSSENNSLSDSKSQNFSVSKDYAQTVHPTMVYFGTAGKRIEGRYLKQKKNTSPAVLILPSDPRRNNRLTSDTSQQALGETINDKIIKIIEKQFQKQGFTTLAINYQGSGKSEGIFREFRDGVMTASMALDWLQSQNTEASHFWIAGYSFGACVAADIGMRRPEIENFIFISPLIEKYDISFMCPSLCNGLIITGEKMNL